MWHFCVYFLYIPLNLWIVQRSSYRKLIALKSNVQFKDHLKNIKVNAHENNQEMEI